MAPKARPVWGLHSPEKCWEKVWDLLIPGMWKECVSSLCHELSLHCHCLSNVFKAPLSLPDDRLSCGKTQGLSRAGACPLGQGLCAVPGSRLGKAGHAGHGLLCVPGSFTPVAVPGSNKYPRA